MTDRSHLLNIFKDLERDVSDIPSQPSINLHTNSRVLIIDAMNLFLRNFCALNSHNLAGHHIGGLIGFLKSLRAMINMHNPTKVILAFDGEKGSQSRKYLYRPYKANRSASKITNPRSFRTAEEEKGSKNDQITRLVDYLRALPVTMVVCDNLEADDIIAHLCTHIYDTYPDSYTYIVSSDQDYMQRVNDRVFLYSPIKQILYTEARVLEEYKIHPLNHNVFKALVGDSSDNLPGVAGIGHKNVIKLFEGLKEPEMKGLEYIYQVCEEKPTNSVLYDRVLFTKNMVETMFQVMDLHNPNIHPDDIEYIENLYDVKAPTLNKSEFLELYTEDRMADNIPYTSKWLDAFAPLNRYK
jgi:5'-3' exonuclease